MNVIMKTIDVYDINIARALNVIRSETNYGTSESVKKSWEKRRGASVSPDGEVTTGKQQKQKSKLAYGLTQKANFASDDAFVHGDSLHNIAASDLHRKASDAHADAARSLPDGAERDKHENMADMHIKKMDFHDAPFKASKGVMNEL